MTDLVQGFRSDSSPATAVSLRALDVLGARNDEDAVAMWVRARGSRSQATRRAYARVGKRLIVWLRQRGIAVAAMTAADAQDHLDALRNPTVGWLIPMTTGGKRAEPSLKSQTLKGPMSENGIRYSRTVLIQMLEYLRTAGYVSNNVFALTEVPAVVVGSVADKTLSPQAR